MLYIEYEEYKNKYYEVQKKYNDILNEKEELFAKTQPKATQINGEKTAGGAGGCRRTASCQWQSGYQRPDQCL